MKKLITLIIFIISLLLASRIILKNKDTQKPIETNTKSMISPSQNEPAVNLPTAVQIHNNNMTYNIYYTSLNNYNLTLIPNFSQLKSFESITKSNNCKSAINGGYYTTDNKPLGLYKSNSTKYSEEIKDSSLLTGYLTIDKNGKADISFLDHIDSPDIIQSGPYISKNTTLKLTADEYARRSLIGKSDTGDLYIVFINNSEEMFNGPLLAEIPEIIFSESVPVRFISVLNLDGGSASAYMDKSGYIFRELTTVGSIICLKQ